MDAALILGQKSHVRDQGWTFAAYALVRKKWLGKSPTTGGPMLIPIADVPRLFAERKPKDAIAIIHAADTLTWEQLERNANSRARPSAAMGFHPRAFPA